MVAMLRTSAVGLPPRGQADQQCETSGWLEHVNSFDSENGVDMFAAPVAGVGSAVESHSGMPDLPLAARVYGQGPMRREVGGSANGSSDGPVIACPVVVRTTIGPQQWQWQQQQLETLPHSGGGSSSGSRSDPVAFAAASELHIPPELSQLRMQDLERLAAWRAEKGNSNDEVESERLRAFAAAVDRQPPQAIGTLANLIRDDSEELFESPRVAEARSRALLCGDVGCLRGASATGCANANSFREPDYDVVGGLNAFLARVDDDTLNYIISKDTSRGGPTTKVEESPREYSI